MGTENKVPQITRKQLGIICVDTGTLAMGDPCHIDSSLDAFPKSGLSRQIKKKLQPGGKTIPTVVTLMTGLGDGFYAVEADIVDVGGGWGQRVKRIEIEFIPDTFWNKPAPDTSAEHADEDGESRPGDEEYYANEDADEEEGDALYNTAYQSGWDTFIKSSSALNDMATNAEAGFTFRELIDVVKAIAAQPEPDKETEEHRFLDRFSHYWAQMVYESFIGCVFTLAEVGIDFAVMVETLERMDAVETLERMDADELGGLVVERDAGQLTDEAALEVTARQKRPVAIDVNQKVRMGPENFSPWVN
jgi:hypothetical protein